MDSPATQKLKYLSVPVLRNGETATWLYIYPETDSMPLHFTENAGEHGESPWQIFEGCFYEYYLKDKSLSLEKTEIITIAKQASHSGRIAPNISVGTVLLKVLDSKGEPFGEAEIEVCSVKTNYRDDYRKMLEDISEKCSDLILRYSSPARQNFEPDTGKDAESDYQRFAFLYSLIRSESFTASVHRVISSPVTRWKETETVKDIRTVRRFGKSEIRQFASGKNRTAVPAGLPLAERIESVPLRLRTENKSETTDTPENRFVKHVLQTFLSFTGRLKTSASGNKRFQSEAAEAEKLLSGWLNNQLFREVSAPRILPLNSPVLQRKEGYREILRAWILYFVAARLVWNGGYEVYRAGKKDVALLYEYWLFFKMLDLISGIFKIEKPGIKDLITYSADKLELNLKAGTKLDIEGIYETAGRNMRVRFSYNRIFGVNNRHTTAGSWTLPMRPDYTISLWPKDLKENEAEENELMLHIHFDAKYRVDNFTELKGRVNAPAEPETSFTEEEEKALQEEMTAVKEEEKKGNYKRADILKMHAYKDAIRRTAGAYILYPGDSPKTLQGFHEIIPGLGAFNIKPAGDKDGTGELAKFIKAVVNNFADRTSQRERSSYSAWNIYKDEPTETVSDRDVHYYPELIDKKRAPVPEDEFVLIGYCKDVAHYNWIVEKGKYNARLTGAGLLRIKSAEASARYLLLHGPGQLRTGYLYRLSAEGPEIYTKQDLKKTEYPKEPSQELYLVYTLTGNPVQPVTIGIEWDIRKLENYRPKRQSGYPFAVSFAELMKAQVKKY